MQLPKVLRDERGQAEAVTLQLTLIISLVVAVIVVYQLFISGAGPTDYAYLDENGDEIYWADIDNTDNENTWSSNADYDASARSIYDNIVTMSWAGIGLMAVAIIILAASVILGVVRGFGGAGRGV